MPRDDAALRHDAVMRHVVFMLPRRFTPAVLSFTPATLFECYIIDARMPAAQRAVTRRADAAAIRYVFAAVTLMP